MKILMKHFTVTGTGSYPDHHSLFSTLEDVTHKGVRYYYCDYNGTKSLGVWDVEDYESTLVPKEKPLVTLDNVQIEGAELNGSIYWVEKGKVITVTADYTSVIDFGQGLTMMAMIEKVVSVTTTTEDIRTKATLKDNVMTMTFYFETSGNYLLKQDRLNQGLDIVGAPFNLSFTDVEFDVYI